MAAPPVAPRAPAPAVPPAGSRRRRPTARLREAARRLPVAALVALLTLGCSGDSTVAQDAGGANAVPSDPELVRRRADRARAKGDTAAPVQILEVSDFQCPYCARFFRETYPALDSLYVETGKVEYIWVALAAPGHERAWPAVEAAFCAGAAGKFWPMHALLFQHQEEWSNADRPTRHFVEYAREAGVEVASFRTCIEQDLPAPLQVQDLQTVSRAGIQATPFFIFNGKASIQGAAGLERFRSVVDSILAAEEDASGGS